jgi:DNA-binding MarR family transcriptional regulator
MEQTNLTSGERQRRKISSAQMKDVAPALDAPPEVLMGYYLWRVHHLWKRHIETHFKEVGLTAKQFVLLAATYHLVSQGEAPSQIRLSQYTNIEKMKVSKDLRVLEERNYLSRKHTPGDRRSNRIQLTALGANVLQRAFSISAREHANFFGTVGSDWKHVNELLRQVMYSHVA